MLPLIMWLVLFAGILGSATIRISRLFDAAYPGRACLDMFFAGLYLMWMFLELRVTLKDVSSGDRKIADRMTCQWYGLGQALTILTALWYARGGGALSASQFTGIVIFMLGGIYRWWAIHTLGRFYSHRVYIAPRHRIVTSGPYRLTRHPAYAGMIVAHAGIAVYFFNWATLVVLVLILLPAILFRIIVEESVLRGIEGYPEFARTRKRLFPAIW